MKPDAGTILSAIAVGMSLASFTLILILLGA